MLYVDEVVKAGIDVRQYLELLKKEHRALRRFGRNGEPYHILPSKTLTVALPGPQEEMVLTVEGNYLSKNALAILDLLISNEWKRPIHFNFNSLNALGLDLTPYVVNEGPVYRLVPERHLGQSIRINTDLAYRNLVERADYSNLKDSTVYFSYEDHYARMLIPIRQSFNALAIALIEEQNLDTAKKAMDVAIAKLYSKHLRPAYTNLQAAEILIALDNYQEAEKLVKSAFQYYCRRVRKDTAAGHNVDRLDNYLLNESAKLLARLDDRSVSCSFNPPPG